MSRTLSVMPDLQHDMHIHVVLNVDYVHLTFNQILTLKHVLLPSTRKTHNCWSANIDTPAGIKVSFAFPKFAPQHTLFSQKVIFTLRLQRDFLRFDIDDKKCTQIYTSKSCSATPLLLGHSCHDYSQRRQLLT